MRRRRVPSRDPHPRGSGNWPWIRCRHRAVGERSQGKANASATRAEVHEIRSRKDEELDGGATLDLAYRRSMRASNGRLRKTVRTSVWNESRRAPCSRVVVISRAEVVETATTVKMPPTRSMNTTMAISTSMRVKAARLLLRIEGEMGNIPFIGFAVFLPFREDADAPIPCMSVRSEALICSG